MVKKKFVILTFSCWVIVVLLFWFSFFCGIEAFHLDEDLSGLQRHYIVSVAILSVNLVGNFSDFRGISPLSAILSFRLCDAAVVF